MYKISGYDFTAWEQHFFGNSADEILEYFSDFPRKLGKLSEAFSFELTLSMPITIAVETFLSIFGWVFYEKILSFKIVMSGLSGVWHWAGVGHRPRFTFWLTIFQSDMLPLLFSGLLSYWTIASLEGPVFIYNPLMAPRTKIEIPVHNAIRRFSCYFIFQRKTMLHIH